MDTITPDKSGHGSSPFSNAGAELRRADTTAGRKAENAGGVPQSRSAVKSPRWLDGLTAKIETENDGKTAGYPLKLTATG
ncbi:hypothetical protein [Pseudocitrobacter faecalis]|uniref:hypothetical protein n=1 Tax=Pseudocitrobacter faecalis TaxID=1398493 RepID=UPI004064A9E5